MDPLGDALGLDSLSLRLPPFSQQLSFFGRICRGFLREERKPSFTYCKKGKYTNNNKSELHTHNTVPMFSKSESINYERNPTTSLLFAFLSFLLATQQPPHRLPQNRVSEEGPGRLA